MNTTRRTLAIGMLATVGLVAAGCSSSDHDHRASRNDNDRYDRRYDDNARTASDHAPWRDENGRLHHDADWKDASDRGRDDNDRDDWSRRGN